MSLLLLIFLGQNVAYTILLRRYYHIFFTQCRVSVGIEWLCYLFAFVVSGFVSLFLNEMLLPCLILNILTDYALTYIYRGSQKLRILLPLSYRSVIFLFELLPIQATMAMSRNLSGIATGIGFHTVTPLYSLLFLYVFVLIAEGVSNTKTGIRFSLKYYICFVLTPLFTFMITLLVLNIPGVSDAQIGICTLILLALNLVAFYFYEIVVSFISNKMEKEIAEEKNLYYAKQLETLTAMSESLRSYQHDLKNHAIIIDAYLTNGDYEKVREYYDQTMRRPLIEYKEFQTGNTTIDSLLNYKSFEANQKGVALKVTVKVPPRLQIRTSAIMLVFGNLLDNAIEAASHTENKTVRVQIIYAQHCLMLMMQNYYVGKIKKSGSRFLTTKENAILHGYGLRNVKRIIHECGGNIKLDYDENIFTAKVLLHDKKQNAKKASENLPIEG